MERTSVTGQDARPNAPTQQQQPSQPAQPGAAPLASSPGVTQRSGASHALSPIAGADAREEQERRRQLVTLGLEVVLAVLVTLATRIWGWVREERARARVTRELRRRLPAT